MNHFIFFIGVPVFFHGICCRNHGQGVERNLFLKDLGVGFAHVEQVPDLFFQLFNAVFPGSGDGLVGGGNNVIDADRVVEWFNHLHQGIVEQFGDAIIPLLPYPEMA